MVYTYACLLSVPYKEKLLPQPDLIHRMQICFSSLSLSLWILVKSQVTVCLPFTTRPCTFDLLIHPVFIFETIRFKRMKRIACLPFLYPLQQHSSIFYIGAAISSEDQIIELAIVFLRLHMFAFCLHSVCIILHLFTAPIKQTTPEEHINATEAQHQAHNYGPVVPLRCLRKGWVWRPETSC